MVFPLYVLFNSASNDKNPYSRYYGSCMEPFTIPRFSGNIKYDEPMGRHSTMGVGGLAPLFVEPFDEESLCLCAGALKQAGKPFFVLGGGSNTILPDKIPFAILSTRRLKTPPAIVETDGKAVTLSLPAGLLWGRVCTFCKENNIDTFAPFSGLPGTVGGALVMNATCFGFSACDALLSVRYLDARDMGLHEYKKDAHDFSYKKSPFQNNDKIILSADFAVVRAPGEKSGEIRALYDSFLSQRVAKKHFSAPSAGSVFKNDVEKSIVAGKIIDECGLKGTRVGGAKIADWHGNFIINEGKASAKDVHDLVNLIKSEVKAKKNIALECEILFAGTEMCIGCVSNRGGH